MKILFDPQVHDERRIKYEFEEDKVIAHYKGKSEEFDFSDLPDGIIDIEDEEGYINRTDEGVQGIDTELGVQPILFAKRDSGVLYVELINYIGMDATEKERFPEWIDHTEYEPPKEDEEGDSDGETEVEE